MTWGGEYGFPWGGDAEHFDFETLGYSKLWKQLDYAQKLRALVAIMAEVWADMDSATQAELAKVGIDAQAGAELDDWGERVGAPRNGMGDDLYRRVIKVEARKALGEGDVQTIYDIVAIFSPTAKATLLEGFPANWIIWLHGLTLEEQDQVGALLDGVPGLGIGAGVVTVDPDGVFEWGDNDGLAAVDWHWDSNDGSVPSSDKAGFASSDVIQ